MCTVTARSPLSHERVKMAEVMDDTQNLCVVVLSPLTQENRMALKDVLLEGALAQEALGTRTHRAWVDRLLFARTSPSPSGL